MQETNHYATYAGAQWTGGSAFSGDVGRDAPARSASSPSGRTSVDRFLVKCNFLVWFVNLAIILPRSLA